MTRLEKARQELRTGGAALLNNRPLTWFLLFVSAHLIGLQLAMQANGAINEAAGIEIVRGPGYNPLLTWQFWTAIGHAAGAMILTVGVITAGISWIVTGRLTDWSWINRLGEQVRDQARQDQEAAR